MPLAVPGCLEGRLAVGKSILRYPDGSQPPIAAGFGEKIAWALIVHCGREAMSYRALEKLS